MFSTSSLLGLVVLVLDIWAIINIAKSGASAGIKVAWIFLIIIVPVLGFIVWLLAGPKSSSA